MSFTNDIFLLGFCPTNMCPIKTFQNSKFDADKYDHNSQVYQTCQENLLFSKTFDRRF